MNFEFTEEQKMIQQAAKDFAERELLPDVIERDTNARFPDAQIVKLAELGFLGMMTDPRYDGGGMDTISYVLAMEEISKIDSSTGVIMSVCNSLVNWGLENYGTEEQKEKYLRPLARGEKIGAFLLSEPEAGSDATKQRTTAVDMGDYYLMNGTKNWITNANSGSVYLVINYELRITNYGGGVNYELRITNYGGISITNYELRITGNFNYELRITNYGELGAKRRPRRRCNAIFTFANLLIAC
jgi:alkylation response protein AidB-like acyl-CoA dehydrogenase